MSGSPFPESRRKRPLFSILVPTKDRASVVVDAVASILAQPGDDFEVVVSNNGGCALTRHAMAAWSDDWRLRYVEPPQLLNMPDHWEWALSGLHGEYILIVTDRSVLRSNALETLRELVARTRGPEAISWPLATYFDLSGMAFGMHTRAGTVSTLPARSVWNGLKSGQYMYSPILPRGLNSCVHRDVYARVREARGRVFDFVSPDFASAFGVIHVSSTIHHYSEPLALSRASHLSNGGLTQRGVDTGYLDSLGVNGRLVHVPIRKPLLSSLMYEDYFRTAAAVGEPISWDDTDPGSYYADCCRDLVRLHFYLKPWDERLTQLRKEFRNALRAEGDRRSFSAMMKMVRRFPWAEARSGLLRSIIGESHLDGLRRVVYRLRNRAVYTTALQAAGFGMKPEGS